MVVNTNILAQTNLVPNGSFEEMSACPEENELIGNGQFERAIGWWRPTWGTPDYFHRCNDTLSVSSQGVVGVPDNFWGYQEPFHGDAYVGIVPIEWMIESGVIIGSEYIQCKLIKKLDKCHSYKLSMYVSMAENSMHAFKNIGAFFSETDIKINNYDKLVRNAQFEYDVDFISDSIEWTKIEGVFTSLNYEEYLTIGYFKENIKGDTLFIQEPLNTFGSTTGYYYIDSVSLIEIGIDQGCLLEKAEDNLPNVITPNGDGVNDEIDLSLWAEYFQFDYIIYDRWGKEVIRLNENNPIWDGRRLNGKLCSNGVYYYILNLNKEEELIQKNGTIHIIGKQ